MLLKDNLCVLAAAGSRKTTYIVEQALEAHKSKRILVTTYTNQNVEQIETSIIKKVGVVPPNISVLSWFRFLLQDGVRPYQRSLTGLPRVIALNTYVQNGIRYTPKAKVDEYYFDSKGNIYSEYVSEFCVEVNKASNGKIVKRLESIYDTILIDEIQDMGGWDLDFLELLLGSTIKLVIVGDPRQSTLRTNTRSQRNRQYRGPDIARWFVKKQSQGLCQIDERTTCFRCNQAICDFADALYPNLPKTTSRTNEITGHDGVFCINKIDVLEYVRKYNPVVLRYNRNSNTMDLDAKNIGISKGQTFDRVLIFPTHGMKTYLRTKNPALAGDIDKLYVAVTRARYSVAFVF